MTVDFEDALERMAPLDRVGPIRLRYEPSMLIGEPFAKDPREPFAIALRVFSLLLGVVALVVLVTSSGGRFPLSALILGALAAAAFSASAYLERGPRARRFILNFGTESLRLDDLPTPLKRPRTRTVHFDQIAAVEVVPDGAGFAIVATLKQAAGRPTREPLTGRVEAQHVEELRRLWRVLRDAFGLSRPSPELR